MPNNSELFKQIDLRIKKMLIDNPIVIDKDTEIKERQTQPEDSLDEDWQSAEIIETLIVLLTILILRFIFEQI